MALLLPPGYQLLDSIANPIASGRVFVYENRTTTLKTIYSNPELTTAVTNPYPLDSNGRLNNGINLYGPDGDLFTLRVEHFSGAPEFTRNDCWGSVNLAGISVQNKTELAALSPSDGISVYVKDVGRYFYDALSSATATGHLVIAPVSGTGRWVFTGTATLATFDNNLQAALDVGGHIYIPSGEYIISAQVDFNSNTTLEGAGPGKTILKFNSAFGDTGQMLRGDDLENITLRNLTIDGNAVGAGGTQDRLAAMVAFSNCTGVAVENCEITNHEYIGLSLLNTTDGKISGCEFHNLGYSGVTSNGGVCLFVSSVGAGGHPNNIRVVDNHFHDNEWTGIQWNAEGGLVDGNVFENNKEAHIFTSYDEAGLTFVGKELIISDNVMTGLTVKDITGQGMEIGGRNVIISGNMITDCDHGGISITNAQNIQVYGNMIGNVSQNSNFWGCINFVNGKTDPDNVKKISVHDNTFFDNQVTPTSYTGFAAAGAGDPMENVEIYNNDLSDVAWVDDGFNILTGSWDLATCRRFNNRGLADVEPYIGLLNITTTGAITVTTIPFPPKTLEIWAYQTSTSDALVSYARVMRDGTLFSFSATAGAADARTTAGTANAIDVRDEAGTVITQATFTAFTYQGFTLNAATHTGGTTAYRYIAHP